MAIEPEREKLSREILALIMETDMSYFDICGVLEAVKNTMMLEDMGRRLPKIMELWKAQAQERAENGEG